MTVILGVVMFTLVILSLVVVLMVAKSKLVAGGEVSVVINDDADNRHSGTCGRDPAECLGGSEDLHPFRLRRQGQLRRLQSGRLRRRRRHAAYRAPSHHPQGGTGRVPPIVPGQGQAGHEDRSPSRGLQRSPVAVQGAVEPERGHLHQGTDSRTPSR